MGHISTWKVFLIIKNIFIMKNLTKIQAMFVCENGGSQRGLIRDWNRYTCR